MKAEFFEKIYIDINNEIIKTFKSGEIPWRIATLAPANAGTGDFYKGINALILSNAIITKQYDSGYWASQADWGKYGVFEAPKTPGTQVLSIYGEYSAVAKHTLYNGSQMNHYWAKESFRESPSIPNYQRADSLIKYASKKVSIVNHPNQCKYIYAENKVVCPPKERFLSEPAYYDSIFHELVHWTEDKVTCDDEWVNNTLKSSNTDAIESIKELRAEMASAFLLAQLSIPSLPSYLPNYRENVDKYMDKWIYLIEKYPLLLTRIAQSASDAVSFLRQL